MPAPPYSSSTVIPSTPRSPNLRHRSTGNALSRSMSAARGAISSPAKASTVARSMSAASPRSKFRPGRRFGRAAIRSSLAGLNRLDDLEAFEFGVAEIQAAVAAGVTVGAAERLRPRPGLEVGLAVPDRVRRIQYVVVVFWASQQVECGEARNA